MMTAQAKPSLEVSISWLVEKDYGSGWEYARSFETYEEARDYFEDRKERFTAVSYRLVSRTLKVEQWDIVERGLRVSDPSSSEAAVPTNQEQSS